MKNLTENAFAKYPLANLLLKLRLIGANICTRDYNFLQHVMHACRSDKGLLEKKSLHEITGPILFGNQLYDSRAELKTLFRHCRQSLYEKLVRAAIFPILEEVLLVPIAAAQTQRTLIWDSSKAYQWLQTHGDRINHWLTDDIFVLCCVGQLAKTQTAGFEEFMDWFLDGNPGRCVYELSELIQKRPEAKAVLKPIAQQFGQGRWKAALDTHNKWVRDVTADMRAFNAADLDLVTFLPLLGEDGKTPRLGEIHEPIHQGGIAYFKT